MDNIVITKVPSFHMAISYTRYVPAKLCDYTLVRTYAKILAIISASNRGLLPVTYYRSVVSSSATGRVPKDAWLIANLNSVKTDFKAEIEKRGLQDSFTVWIELLQSA